ncbi:MAG: glutamine--fructose-6-phosphate transaminase (isomerizing) [Pseudomonadota bacterium]
MCGIIGILGQRAGVAERILDRLTALEYRGYDSAGVAVLSDSGIERRRASGKLINLKNTLADDPLGGTTGIGHTRWATHGAPTVTNAHPHTGHGVAIVHNGIIENHAELHERLVGGGVQFESETDTEVIAHLISHYLNSDEKSPLEATAAAVRELKGAYAIVVLFEAYPDQLTAARMGSPLVVGHKAGEAFVGSDAYALATLTNRVRYLEDGDVALLSGEDIQVLDAGGKPAARPIKIANVVTDATDKGQYRHFMLKEIFEQPEVIGHTLSQFLDASTKKFDDRIADLALENADRLIMSACGTAFYAASIARYWFEAWAHLSVDIDIASEFRYRDYPYTDNGAALFISQSGETADTIAALVNAKAQRQRIAAIVNMPESTIAREADHVFYTAAGVEVGVASTKAFVSQLMVLACIAAVAGERRGVLGKEGPALDQITQEMLKLPRKLASALLLAPQIEKIASELSKARDVLYIGRGVSFPLAMEGALKLKEISYIHAEGYAAGELKHGPIALIDEKTPTVAIAPTDKHFEKTLSNVQEVTARGGRTILFTDEAGAKAGGGIASEIVIVPDCDPLLSPIVYAAPVQLLAYYTALAKGTDVDQPRNLAKSVTVE